ncbi:hypothetical protein V8E36_009935 [Tilletia maclaganii]
MSTAFDGEEVTMRSQYPDNGPLSDLSVSSSASHSRSLMEKAAEVLASLKTEGSNMAKSTDGASQRADSESLSEHEDLATTCRDLAGPSTARLNVNWFPESQQSDDVLSSAPSTPLSSLTSSDEDEDENDSDFELKRPNRRASARLTHRQTSLSKASASNSTSPAPTAASRTPETPVGRTYAPASSERREFPPGTPIDPSLPLLYQRYYVPSSLEPHLWPIIFGGTKVQNFDEEIEAEAQRGTRIPRRAVFREPPSLLNLYAPRYVRGQGMSKEGLCPICWESGEEKFYKTKQSAFNYHLLFAHGISAVTGEPFAPPLEIKTMQRPLKEVRPLEKEYIKVGKCHVCKQFIPIENVKNVDINVPEIVWWPLSFLRLDHRKHANSCHKKGKALDGAHGTFVENAFFHRVNAYVQAHENQ